MALSLFSANLYAQTTVNVEISGIDKILEDNVRLYLSIEQQKNHPLISDGRLARLHKKAAQEISAALQPYGFYRSTINASLEKSTTGEWLARYEIDPGPPLLITEFNFSISREMGEDPEFRQLVEQDTLQSGNVFTHLEYEGFKANLAKLASERGYFRAVFTVRRVEVDLEDYVARIYLDYDGGPRFRFGEIKLRQDVLRPEFLERFLPFGQGDAYSLDKLIELQQVLNDTNYFQTVEVSPGEPLPTSNEIPIEVSLTPRKENRYEFGLGYGSDTGARTKFGWEKPRVNDRGHRFDSEIRISEVGYNLGANYRVPVLNPRTDQLVYSISEINEEVEDVDSDLRAVGVSLNRSRGEWRETLALDYEREDFEIGNDADKTSLLIPGITWSRTWGRNFIFVLDGLRFDFGLRGADEGFGSDVEFGQASARLKFISSLNRNNRFIARGTIGSTTTPDFEKLPPSKRFFAGGSQSVRGYKYQSLGPEDESGDVIGARRLLTGSIEFEHSLNDNWGIAVFYDVGNAVEDFDDELERGAGFGLRWKSPVGPVRIDAASALSDDGEPWRLHINIGPDL
ncbi:MAG: autotransporter assembly complex protein TamA [Gammaproteobacteria bacterium]|nr:autotransporter assembly complex protein TamA [Gammaproteobacteria bacterium]